MRAAILYGAHDFRIEEIPDLKIEDDECLVSVKACGVCHSEIHQWETKIEGLEYPRHIGHEVAGEILEVGSSVSGFKIGDRVAVWTDGKGYSDKVVAKTDVLSPIANDIPFEQALSEPIACTTNGVMKANVQLDDTVVLVGTGFMGLILLQELKQLGTKKLIAVDIRDEMLVLAKELGADLIINPQKENVVESVRLLTNSKGADVCFEIGGVESTLNLAADLCRMEGKLVIFGYHPGSRTIKDLGYWNWMAFNIINAHFRDKNTILNGMRIGMNLLNEQKINMTKLITHTYPLEKIEDAFIAAKNKPDGFIKSVILMK
ncbi:MAG: zinc-dependent alcohol dehydrogenase [Ignavibacteriaceae bacterium]